MAIKASAVIEVDKHEVRIDIKLHEGDLFFRIADGPALTDWKLLPK